MAARKPSDMNVGWYANSTAGLNSAAHIVATVAATVAWTANSKALMLLADSDETWYESEQ